MDDSTGARSEADTSAGATRMWLFKIPKAVEELWATAKNRDELGRLIVSQDISGKMRATMELSESLIAAQQAAMEDPSSQPPPPTRHTLELETVTPNTMHVITESSGEVFALAGRLERRGDAQPVESEEYRRFCRERSKRANTPSRLAQKITGPVLPSNMARMVNMGQPVARGGEARDKRTCMDRDELLKILFGKFEEREGWKLLDLQRVTDQPLGHLRNVVEQIADRVTTGPERGAYYLKPEYKH
eukprot:m51a1_g2246 putative general transcription factor iif subunit 2 (246) ;mRNA; f:289175-290097